MPRRPDKTPEALPGPVKAIPGATACPTLIYAKLADIHIDSADESSQTHLGNRLYLVNNVSGLSHSTLRQLALMHPVIVRRVEDHYAPVANLRTLSLLKTGLDDQESLPVLLVESTDPTPWAILDSLVSPLLHALDPAAAAEQLDATCLELPASEVKACWNGAQTTAGLAKLLGIPRLQLYRRRSPRAPDRQEPTKDVPEKS